MQCNPHRVILQGVYELYDKTETILWKEMEPHINRLVFIGNTIMINIVMSHHCT